MDMLEKATRIAIEAHEGQVDLSGKEYVLHVMRVRNSLVTYKDKIVGVLHDVIEDTDWTAARLLDEGFSKEIVDAIVSVSHIDGEDDYDYIMRVKANKIGTRVKMADIRDNNDLTRFKKPRAVDRMRVRKNNLVLKMLKN